MATKEEAAKARATQLQRLQQEELQRSIEKATGAPSQSRPSSTIFATPNATTTATVTFDVTKNPLKFNPERNFTAGGIPITAQTSFTEPKKQTPPVAGGTTPSSATGPANAPVSGQREITCPNCEGDYLSKTAGRIFSTIGGFLQRTFNIRIPTVIINYLKERLKINKLTAFNGDCLVCNGTRKIVDPSDDTQKYAEAAQKAESYAPEIEQNEAKLGNGGNRYTIVQNSEVLEVGIGMNDAPSYRVDKDAGYRLRGLAGFGKGSGQINPKYGPVPQGGNANHVQGLNVPAAPGGSGHYTIKCSNKFSLVTGSQGIELVTSGPVTINGGITSFTGAEVTVGSRTGKLALEGDVVNIGGRSIEVGPTDGHFVVKGTISNTGNIICGGHSHLESASVVKLETTGRNESSKVSSSNNIATGPAFWGGPAVEGITLASRGLLTFISTNLAHPEQAKLIASARYGMGLYEEVLNIAYSSLPAEVVPCGFALLGAVPLPVFLWPHTHALPDQMHCHETRIPDIKCDADTAEQLRTEQAGVDGPAPMHKTSTSIIDVAVGVWGTVSTAVAGVFAPKQNLVYRLKGTKAV
jgi:hypothetical protein